ncbi:sodium:calcium antiporter, partial [Patescibacteria group bacterium]|nr:sodium:calcium antiporter [Patescibacteria group bacterium]
MSLLFAIILVVVGFIALVKGADLLVAGASSLAKRLGVSTLLVGLTVVAFGTSMPELVVNIFAVTKGTVDIAIGNIIGSNIANIALVLGLAAAFYPIRVQHSTTWKEIPFALLAVVTVAILSGDVIFNGSLRNELGRGDGLILISFAIIFLYYVLGLARRGQSEFFEMANMSGRRIAVSLIIGTIALV